MNALKILFLGVGSIAKRHIVNVCKVCGERQIEVQVDVYRSSVRVLDDELKQYVSKVYYTYEELPDDYDVIFITNPTEYHLDTLIQIHDKGRHFFIEKPICTLEQIKSFDLDYLSKDKTYYVACPLRYTKVLQYVKQCINLEEVYSVRCISSSYLPDWRPGVDYRNTYSAKKALGGGVAIDLIHEWDYISYLFGMPNKVYSFLKTVSNLEIDTEDIAIYIGEYDDKMVELHLDYFGRKTIRKMELFTKDETMECDLVESKISFRNEGKVIEFKEERNAFQMEEIRHFIDMISLDRKENYVPKAMEVLKLTKGDR